VASGQESAVSETLISEASGMNGSEAMFVFVRISEEA